MKQIPVAVQMFTLRKEAAEDFAGTLKKVAEIGYDGVELAGHGGLRVGEVRALLDTYGLKAAASHVPLDALTTRLDAVIADQKVLGSNYIVCPFLLPEQRNTAFYKELIPKLDAIGEACREAGITFCYHNHDFELDYLPDGRTVLEAMLADTKQENVQAEFDIYWLATRGESPVEWLHRYPGRTPLVHLKDMTTDGKKFFAELGTGGVDVAGVLEQGQELGVDWWIVEQDETRLETPFESIRKSLDYVREWYAE